MKIFQSFKLLSFGSLVCISLAGVFFDRPAYAQSPKSVAGPVQPSLGYDDVGLALYKDEMLQITTFIWKATESKSEKNVVTWSTETRPGRKPQLNPKTGQQEMVDHTYQLRVPRTSKKVVVTRATTAVSSAVTEYKPEEYSVYTLDGRHVLGAELMSSLGTQRTVLVLKAKEELVLEDSPQFGELFRGMLHPNLLIVRIHATVTAQAGAQISP